MGTSREYYIEWNIQVSAKTPEEAVLHAVEIMRDITSTATWFHVIKLGGGDLGLKDYDEIIHPELYEEEE